MGPPGAMDERLDLQAVVLWGSDGDFKKVGPTGSFQVIGVMPNFSLLCLTVR